MSATDRCPKCRVNQKPVEEDHCDECSAVLNNYGAENRHLDAEDGGSDE